MIDQMLASDLERFLQGRKDGEIREFFREMHPSEIAEILLDLDPEDVLLALKTLGKKEAAAVFREFPRAFQAETAELLDTPDLAKLAESLEPDDRVDFLKALPRERYAAALAALPKNARETVQRLAQYPEGSAGSIMTTEFLALGPETAAGEAIEIVRLDVARVRPTQTVFVVDDARVLKGVVPLADLIAAAPDKKLREIMDGKARRVDALNGAAETVHLFSRYGLVALAVVTPDDALVGAITHDDMVAALERERTGDMERFMAISGLHRNTPYLHTTIWEHFRNRAGWLVILALLGFLAGSVLQSAEKTFSNLLLLVFYIPVLLRAGGGAGSQSAAVVVRSLALGEIKPRDAFPVIWREVRLSILLGLVLGFLVFGRVLVAASLSHMQVPGAITALDIGIAVGIALVLQVIVSTLISSSLPFLAALMGRDPASVSSPVIVSIMDITGLLIYFSVAKSLLGI